MKQPSNTNNQYQTRGKYIEQTTKTLKKFWHFEIVLLDVTF